MALIRAGERLKGSPVKAAILFRDGLILVFAALVAPRLGSIPVMALDRHLLKVGDSYKVTWSADELKGGQPYEARLGYDLSRLFGRYIERHRPVLQNRSRELNDGLWLSRDGAPLGQRSVALRITTRTEQALGIPVFPHALRHGAATTLAAERPDLIDIVTPLLQHRDVRSRTFYDLADGVAASGSFINALEARRTASLEGRRLIRRASWLAGGDIARECS
jgi:hypothetical protein